MPSGGVQNLRALFENSQNSLSPDRGRSGASSEAGAEASPRPLSKVRASFVAVSKIGHQGHQMTHTNISNESTNLQISCPSENYITTETSVCTGGSTEKTSPKSARSKISSKADKQSKANLDDSKTRNTNDKPPKPISKTLDGHENKNKSTAERKTPEKPPKSILPHSNQPTPSTRSPEQKNYNNSTTLPHSHSESERKNSKTSEESKTSPSTMNISKNASKPASKSQPQDSSPQSRIKQSHPKPSSKPIKPPTYPSTHTASSSSKPSRASTSAAHQQNVKQISGKNLYLIRPQSQTGNISNLSSVPKGLKTRSTASQSQKGDPGKKSSNQSFIYNDASLAESSFLARMMRPTTSSASKATERANLTPREIKSNSRPLTGDGTRDQRAKSETRKHSSITTKDKKEVNLRPKSRATFSPKGSSRDKLKNNPKKPIPDKLKEDVMPTTEAIQAGKSEEFSDSKGTLGDKNVRNGLTMAEINSNSSAGNSNNELDVNLKSEMTNNSGEVPFIVTPTLEIEGEALTESAVLITNPEDLEIIDLNQDKKDDQHTSENVGCVEKGNLMNHQDSDKEIMDSTVENQKALATNSSAEINSTADLDPAIPSAEIVTSADSATGNLSTEINATPDLNPAIPSTEIVSSADSAIEISSSEINATPDLNPAISSAEILTSADSATGISSTEIITTADYDSANKSSERLTHCLEDPEDCLVPLERDTHFSNGEIIENIESIKI